MQECSEKDMEILNPIELPLLAVIACWIDEDQCHLNNKTQTNTKDPEIFTCVFKNLLLMLEPLVNFLTQQRLLVVCDKLLHFFQIAWPVPTLVISS